MNQPDDYEKLWSELRTLLFLPLSRGGFTSITASDYPVTVGYSWRRLSKKYVVASKNGTTVYLHRLLAGFPKGMDVDHRNGCGLNNHRSNLRVCTHAQNQLNIRRHKKSVGIDVESGVFVARFSGRVVGRFTTKEAAQAAWNAAAIADRGEFAFQHSPENTAGEQIITCSKLGYRGAYAHGQLPGRFNAMFRNKYLGLFDSIEDAARAYDRAAFAALGNRARLNFPSELLNAVA